ncbi:MAG: L-threonylcarbamoyladenylate synthase [Marinilabiliales bacterium]
MLLKIFDPNTNPKHIQQVVDILQNDGIVIYPTDSVYGLGGSINSHKAIEKIASIKGISVEKANFSFIFSDLSQLSEYTRPISNNVFKLMNRNLPGPFTFILEANRNIPKIFKNKKKTIGIRIPDNNIIRSIVETMGNPVMNTSVYDKDDILEYTTDPELIHENYKDIVDLVIDGGYGNNIASTVVDCTGDKIEIIRQGAGELIL